MEEAKKPDVRTEEEKLLKAPATVVLGGKEYEIKPLVIKDSREWRKQVLELLGEIPNYLEAKTTEKGEFAGAMDALMVTVPERITDLFFSYARGLPREQIEAEATESELTEAFAVVMRLAFPLLGGLMRITKGLAL